MSAPCLHSTVIVSLCHRIVRIPDCSISLIRTWPTFAFKEVTAIDFNLLDIGLTDYLIDKLVSVFIGERVNCLRVNYGDEV
jgi:hypothetical protein